MRFKDRCVQWAACLPLICLRRGGRRGEHLGIRMIRRLLQRLDEILSVFWVYAPQGALPDTLWRRKRNISGQKKEKAAKRVRAASRTGQRFSAAAKTGVCVLLLLPFGSDESPVILVCGFQCMDRIYRHKLLGCASVCNFNLLHTETTDHLVN